MNDQRNLDIITFMATLEGRSNCSSVELQQLFNYHNLVFPDIKEYGTHCSSCHVRVYNRMKTYVFNLTASL